MRLAKVVPENYHWKSFETVRFPKIHAYSTLEKQLEDTECATLAL